MMRSKWTALWALLVAACLCVPAGAQTDATKRFNRLLSEGSALVKKKEYEAAREKFEAAALLKPKNHNPSYRIADTYRRERDWDHAAEYARKSFDLKKEWRTWVILRDAARQFIREKAYEKAVPLLELGLEYRPEDTYNYDLMGQALAPLEDFGRVASLGEKGLGFYFDYYEKNPKKKVYARSFVTYWARALFHLEKLRARIGEFEAKHGAVDKMGDPARAVLARMYVELGRGLYGEERYALAAEVLKKAQGVWEKDVEAHRLYARSVQRTDGREAAIEALQSSISIFPGQHWLISELATQFYAEHRYDEALKYYRQLLEKRSDNRWYIDRVISCLTKLDRYEEAAAELQAKLTELRSQAREKPQLRKTIDYLETRNLDILDRSGILQRRLDKGLELLVDQPTSAPLHNEVAEFYMHQGRSLLALSHHLEAACLTGNADELAKQAESLVRSRREGEAMPYVHAMIDHFPTHPKIFTILDRMVQMVGIRGRRRFALEDNQYAALALAEKACRRILERPDLEPKMKVEATIAALRYHYEALPNEPGLWMQARAEAARLLDDPSVDGELRVKVLTWMADIDQDRLEDSQSAYNLLLEAVRIEPEHGTLNKLADVALNMTPRPDPAPLEKYLADTPPRNRRTAGLRLKLIQWLWDRGQRQEAIEALREEATRFSDVADRRKNERAGRVWQWFVDQMRRSRPDLLKAAWHEGALPSQKVETATEAELITQKVFLTSTPNMELADPVTRFDQTILTIPPEWGAIDRVRAVAAHRPKISRPPAYFAPENDGRSVGTWWPSEPSIMEPVRLDTAADEGEAVAETVRISLESEHDPAPLHGITVRRSYVDEGEDENSALFHVYVKCPQPHEVRLTLGRGLRNARDFDPDFGEKEGRDGAVVFKNLPRGRSADTGTTFTVRCDRPAGWRTGVEDEFPIVDVLVDERTSEISLAPEPGGDSRECWLIDDAGQEVCFQIDVAGGGVVSPGSKARLVRRTLYRLEWGRKPW